MSVYLSDAIEDTMNDIERAVWKYVAAYFAHDQAKRDSVGAQAREHQTCLEYQTLWRDIHRTLPPRGMHLIEYAGRVYAVEYGSGDYREPVPVVGEIIVP